jgi:glycosyltransferase involved in cell wall biosynthesis
MTVPSAPIVTCVMPTRDRPGFVELAIRCFLRQDFPSKELLILDDSRQPLDRALVADARIRYMHLGQPLSIGAKRNLGCQEARGKLVVQWDDDDWHGPGRIRRQVEPLLSGQADITGLSHALVLDMARWEFWQPSAEAFRRISFAGVVCGTLAYRRLVTERLTRYPHVSLGEDVGFLRPALLAGCRLQAVPARRDFVVVRHGQNTWQMRDEFRRFGAGQIAAANISRQDQAHFERLRQFSHALTQLPLARPTIAPVAADAPRAINQLPAGRGLVRGRRNVNGRGLHRSGWAYAFAGLEQVNLPILFDDFVEQSFCYGSAAPSYREPWVGVFHHPPAMPSPAPAHQRPDVYFQSAAFRASRPALRGAIALSKYLADWLAPRLGVPVVALKHPSERAQSWSPECLAGGGRPKLLQVGFYLRNTLAIDQIPPAIPFVRTRLLPNRALLWAGDWHRSVIDHWARLGTRRSWPGVNTIPSADNGQYDRLLASSIVLTEVFDASANNVVVECIARGTPVVVNRHPAVCEYVGHGYPLLFDSIEQVPWLLADRERIVAAHRHLVARRGPWLNAGNFAAQVAQFCREVANGDNARAIAS